MKKVLTFVIALLVISAITPVMASATRTAVAGSAILSVTDIGEVRITKSGIMHQVAAQASGPVIGATLSGQMQIELNANFNINTGEGVAFGTFVITDSQGTFEGVFKVRDTGFIYFEGSLEGRGTAAYDGMILRLQFEGIDLYRGGYTGSDGLNMTYTGFMLSPKGV